MDIGIAGTGNMAHRLIPALQHAGLKVTRIWGRDKSKVEPLASKYQLKSCSTPEDMDTEWLFFCVSDDAIAEVAALFQAFRGIAVHTSGSIPSTVLNHYHQFGVIWPVQTITRLGKTSLEKVPLCITASDSETQESIVQIAGMLSTKVYTLDDEQRLRIHLTAVMTNNFMNHLAILSREYLEHHNLDYEIIVPLIRTTLEKITQAPYNFEQTGPAVRNDERVIQSHLHLLEENPDLHKIYQIITESIQSHAHH